MNENIISNVPKTHSRSHYFFKYNIQPQVTQAIEKIIRNTYIIPDFDLAIYEILIFKDYTFRVCVEGSLEIVTLTFCLDYDL